MGHKNRRYVQSSSANERRRSRVPRRIAPCHMRRPCSAGREARSVALADDKTFARKAHYRPSSLHVEKAFVLFRGVAGKRLKPVSVMRCALGNRPFLHCRSHRACYRNVELFACLHSGTERVVDLAWKRFLLYRVRKDVFRKFFG